MSISLKAQRSYYVTESSIELPAKVEDIDALVRELRADGKMVVVYSGGGVQGTTVEQKTRIPAHVDDQVRELLNLGTKKIG
ncbi:MAG TPA: hypothetical protein VFW94_24425 [Candidatus Acidoferrales bacterium]|nr:hypothetical protein [Candidatus Acidoferrales bacterium]